MVGSGGGVPVVAHVVYRMDTGGMENGLVNIINRMPPERYRHVIVSLTATGQFGRRIARDDVDIVNQGESPGHSYGRYVRLWRVLKRLEPAIVHTRNLPTLEAQIPAALLGGVKRVHGEHGRDVSDLHGSSRKYKLLRRAVDPLIHRYIAVSRDLEQWLAEGLGIAAGRVRQIYNGVALDLFHERHRDRRTIGGGQGSTGLAEGLRGPCGVQCTGGPGFAACHRGGGPTPGRVGIGHPASRSGAAGLARRRSDRHSSGAAMLRHFCSAVVGGGHFKHHPGSDGHGVAGGGHQGWG
jgi:glycosyltransferase involved in cell wall biosynthesis